MRFLPIRLSAISANSVETDEGVAVRIGETIGAWTLMATAADASWAVFEDFSHVLGSAWIVRVNGEKDEFRKSAEPTFADPGKLYRGHTLGEVIESDHDLLAREILAVGDDPGYEDVAVCVAPIAKMDTYAFVGTRECPDKVGVTYGGRTPNFDPAVYVPSIKTIRDEGRVLDGLVGDWLPVLRFVYPEGDGDWAECIMFAPFGAPSFNPNIQPVYYRVSLIRNHELQWAKYFDSYHTAPIEPAEFYRGLLRLREGWEDVTSRGAHIEIPDKRLADQARHSVVRAMITRIGSFPKYGVMDRNYGGAEHDGFQDTFNVDVTAMLEWGLSDIAREYVDNYLSSFVRDDGSIVYRGPQFGQYGRMLTVVAQYFHYTGDAELLLEHQTRIDAIAKILLDLREKAKMRPLQDAAYGMIEGWCEADSCLEAEPDRYRQPYFSNSTEAARGFRELGHAWQTIGQTRYDPEREEWGEELLRQAEELETDLESALDRSLLPTDPPSTPAIAGASEPPHVAASRDPSDPQFRAYRTYSEMLFSGSFNPWYVRNIVRYRESHRDVLLGVPTGYGYNSGEMAGFLSYGHAYGLLQCDMVREYLLLLYSLSAHQYTRGTWTAPETRRLDPDAPAAPYCVPAQLTVPLLLRWLLVFENPYHEALWLCRATPREWLADGSLVAASDVPTRWGKVSFRIYSHLSKGRIEALVSMPDAAEPREVFLRLRLPEGRSIISVTIDEKPWDKFDADTGTIELPVRLMARLTVVAHY